MRASRLLGGMSRRSFIAGSAAAAAATTLPIVKSYAQDGFVEFHSKPSMIWIFGESEPGTPVTAFNDQVPGPTLRVKQGERVKVRVLNELDEATTIHWHGIRIDNRMDGVPGLTQEPIPPGGSFDYDFVAPDAGTYWYHSHLTAHEQVDRGLYGALIVEEPVPLAVDRDIWLVFDDWRLDDRNCIDERSFGSRYEWAREGRIGNIFTVNGQINPSFPVRRGERVRLRCVNACNAAAVWFDMGGLPLQLIAHDGQFLPEPQLRQNRTTPLWPGQRLDFVVEIDDSVAEHVQLRRLYQGLNVPCATFDVVGTVPRVAALEPIRLVGNPLQDIDLDNAIEVDFLIEGGSNATRQLGFRRNFNYRDEGLFWTINGVSGDPHEGFVEQGPPLFEVERGKTVIVNMTNRTFFPHAMHFHGHHVKSLMRSGSRLEDQPWRDVETVRTLNETLTFAFVADNPGIWLAHCHMVEHHAAGMGTWFIVK